MTESNPIQRLTKTEDLQIEFTPTEPQLVSESNRKQRL